MASIFERNGLTTKIRSLIGMALLFSVCLGFAPYVFAAPCGAKFAIGKASIVQFFGTTEYKLENTTTEIFGAVIQRKVSLNFGPRGLEIGVDLGGEGDFRFIYSGNIRRVRIYSQSEKVYDGKPIPSFRGKRNVPLDLELDVEGAVTVQVFDQCMTSSFFDPVQGAR